MNTIKSTLAIAALAAAVSAPVNTAFAGEGPFEIKGKNVFEIQREAKAKKMAKEQTQDGTKQISGDTMKKNWLERIFSNTKKSAS